MHKYLIFFIFQISLLLSDGSYQYDTITELDGIRNGPDYAGGIIYYPLDIESEIPIVVMIPGFASYISSVDDWGGYLASHGIATMFVNVNNIYFNPTYRAFALLDGITTIKLENERIGSPLYQKLDINSIAVSGWSMGGGGAQLAAQQDQTIKTVLALSPWLDNPNDTFNNSTPILFLSGQNDNIASNFFHTNVFYNNTPINIDKLLFEVSGGNHYTVCSPYNNELMADKVIFWLEYFLLNDTSNCEVLISEPINSSLFLTNIECNNIILGDFNQDGIINIPDVVSAINIVLQQDYTNLIDMNQDSFINISDIIIMVDIILNQ